MELQPSGTIHLLLEKNLPEGSRKRWRLHFLRCCAAWNEVLEEIWSYCFHNPVEPSSLCKPAWACFPSKYSLVRNTIQGAPWALHQTPINQALRLSAYLVWLVGLGREKQLKRIDPMRQCWQERGWKVGWFRMTAERTYFHFHRRWHDSVARQQPENAEEYSCCFSPTLHPPHSCSITWLG